MPANASAEGTKTDQEATRGASNGPRTPLGPANATAEGAKTEQEATRGVSQIGNFNQKPDCKMFNVADCFVKVDLGTAPPHDAEAGSHGAADHELT